MVLSSFMEQQALISRPPDFSPACLLANIVEALALPRRLGWIAEFIHCRLLTTAVAICRCAGGYALARLSVPGANPILLIVLATQMFPAIVIAIPLPF
jgi:ABC-type glycerol-3-phosphate transport system permease component